MAFIRQKQIKGINYYYLVKSVRDKRDKEKVKQVFLKYIGSKIPSKKKIDELRKKNMKRINK